METPVSDSLPQAVQGRIIRYWVIPLAIALVFFIISFFLLAVIPLHKNLMEERKDGIREMVQTVEGILKEYHTEQLAGNIEQTEAQQLARETIRPLRHGLQGDDYFFIIHQDGTSILHPLRQSLEGTDVSYVTDPSGKPYIRELITLAQRNGEGYVQYLWHDADHPKGYTPKIAYVRFFQPWGWIIGTGVYTRDIDQRVNSIVWGLFWFSAIGLSIIAILSTVILTRATRTERQRLEAEESLRTSEAKYRQLHESLMDGFVLVNMQGQVLETNRTFQKMLDYSQEQLSQLTYQDLTPQKWHSDEQTIVLEQILPRGYSDVYEKEYQRKDGTIFPVELRTFLLQDKQNTPTAMWAIVRDITDRKQAEENISQLNKTLEERVRKRTLQLEEVNSELESFSYSVSHDLQSPLRRIDGFIRMLEEDYNDILDAAGRNYIQRVRRATKAMAQLIEDMLKLSRISRTDLSRTTVDLSEMANEILSNLQANEPNRHVEFDIAADLKLQADESFMQIVMENLLGNAWKFTRKQPQAKIEVGMTKQESQNVYFVRDNGAGFNMDHADKLFSVFQRLHTKDEFEGTGIGLTTVQRIIHRHQGQIWAEGQPNKGATFYFTV